ncbi:MAG: hypothetical protein DCC56_00240 [Anaerolineae bacterium]|nr:MAG: hypothetical protein DCC56_00240 [Anaerolineae bacterium]WKZ44460.1 MAG: hypothetical protein QY302_01555 [Anaerolineales bacterium]
MLTEYHIEIMFESLGDHLGTRAIALMTNANIHQDRFAGQFGHDEFHFDNNAFEKTYKYIEEQRALVVDSLKKKDAVSAWQAFGRMTHTVQDFYAHSNYVTLWLNRFDGQTPPPPGEIDPLHPDLIHSPDLRSGKTYPPLEYLYFVKSLRRYVLPLIPRDSHAWMNLDSPEQGFKFEYAMQAAIKRTRIEYERTMSGLPRELIALFNG